MLHDMVSKSAHVSRLLTITIEICGSEKNKLLDHSNCILIVRIDSSFCVGYKNIANLLLNPQ